MGDPGREVLFVDVDADARHGEIETAAGDAVLREVTGQLVVMHVHVVRPFDEHIGNIFSEEKPCGCGEPKVEDELVGSLQTRV